MRRRSSRPPPLGRWLLSFVLLSCAMFSLASAWVGLRFRARILPRAQAPEAPVALVFGAGLSAPGVPSPVLAARLDAAHALFEAGKVEILLLSGDNRERSHDETGAMRRYLLERGIPAEALWIDRLGLSTYDSISRAQALFGVDRAILVTQRFHLPRALYLAQGLGLEAWGVAADANPDKPSPYAWRELIGRPFALAQVLLRPPHAIIEVERGEAILKPERQGGTGLKAPPVSSGHAP